MRAVIVREFGGLDAPTLGELPEPVPGPLEVQVAVHAVAVNYVDLLVIGGKYQFLPERPFAPGKGPAGVVTAVGASVGRFKVGDRVLAMAEQGGYAETVTVGEASCYRLPPSMSFVDAAAMALVYDTSWFALRERARYKPGEIVLVLGASGAVGYAAVQLAKAMDATVLAGIATQDKADMARQAGADAVIDLSRPDLRDSLRAQVYEATGGRGADIILDPLGGDMFDAALRALAWRGRLVVIGFAAGRIPSVKANYLLVKNIEVSGLQVSDYRKKEPEQMAACFSELFAYAEAGKLKPLVMATYPLERWADALRMIRDRSARGRIVLTTGR
ncbi:MAG TPA: NADPH:quinone oxidoreductase family protein [Candidatus Sulfotelmatobacter sp.]|nr:NADPH:quinone oxidoreductase family protein [Candidatus Sulfotelmatobacter sp.]